MATQTSTDSQISDRYPLFTDLKFTIGCPRQIDDNECGICILDVAEQQTLTHADGSCEVTYCLDCWESHLERSIRCPNCRCDLTFDLAVNSQLLVGKAREIHEQPWLMRRRQRANGLDWLRNRYGSYDMFPAYSYSAMVERMHAESRDRSSPHTFDELMDRQGPWTLRLIQRASFFLDLVWVYGALMETLGWLRLHVHSDLEGRIFDANEGRPSLWSEVAADLAETSELETIERAVHEWAAENTTIMYSEWWWDEVQIALEPQYLRDEADRQHVD